MIGLYCRRQLSPLARRLCFCALLGLILTPGRPAAAETLTAEPGAERFTFAIFADLHLTAELRPAFERALDFVQQELRPKFVIFLGDNNGQTADPPTPGRPVDYDRAVIFRELLAQKLHLPYYALPGDNWARGWEQVFGSFHFAFDCGGVHFQFAGLDRDADQDDGLAVFADASLDWLLAGLKGAAGRPALLFLHEPIRPPTFLDAERLRLRLQAAPNLAAVCSGHLHIDLDIADGPIHHLTIASFGKVPGGPFRLVRVRDAGLKMENYREISGAYRRQEELFIPWRAGTNLPAAAKGQISNFVSLPPSPRTVDPELAKRDWEYLRQIWEYMKDPSCLNNLGRLSAAWQIYHDHKKNRR